jgi:hypothetical protein
MILRPTLSRVIMAAAITGRDSTARYSAMRGPTAAWRAMAQGGPHQEAMAISLSLSDLDCSLQMTRRATKRAPVTAVLTGVRHAELIIACADVRARGRPLKGGSKRTTPERVAFEYEVLE